MPTGDELNFVLFLAASGIACLIAAIQSAPGWRSIVLWILAFAFFGWDGGWLLYPNAGFLRRPLALGYALSPLIAVGVVVLMFPRRPKTAGELQKTRAPSLETPDINLMRACVLIVSFTTWNGDPEDILHEIRDKMAMGKLTVWGTLDPNVAVEEIDPEILKVGTLVPKNSTIIARAVTYHRVQLSRSEIYAVWPRKPDRV